MSRNDKGNRRWTIYGQENMKMMGKYWRKREDKKREEMSVKLCEQTTKT